MNQNKYKFVPLNIKQCWTYILSCALLWLTIIIIVFVVSWGCRKSLISSSLLARRGFPLIFDFSSFPRQSAWLTQCRYWIVVVYDDVRSAYHINCLLDLPHLRVWEALRSTKHRKSGIHNFLKFSWICRNMIIYFWVPKAWKILFLLSSFTNMFS